MSKNRNVIFLREEYGDGQGTFTYNDGKYVGKWKKDKQHDQGTFIWSDGDSYTEGNGRKGNQMVWEHTLSLMEISMR